MSWIWILILSPPLHPTDRDISIKKKKQIVGFQTDKPFKRGLQVNGGIRMAMKACSGQWIEVDPEVVDFYTKLQKDS